MDNVEIGKRLKARREYLGLSQKAVADRLGVTAPGYGHYETGRSGVSAADLGRLAKILDVEVSYFYGEDEYAPDHTPLELERIHGYQARIFHALPPGKARARYIESLKAQAETNWALIEDRLRREEEENETGA